MTPSATSPRRSPCSCRPRSGRATCRWPTGSNGCCPLREAGEDDAAGGDRRGLAGDGRPQRFVWNKLISGAFRVGVSQQLVTRALAKVSGVDAAVVGPPSDGRLGAVAAFYDRTPAHRRPRRRRQPAVSVLPGLPARRRRRSRSARSAAGRPNGSGTASAPSSSAAGASTFLWTRGEELVTDRYPELAAARPAAARGHRHRRRDPPLAGRRAPAVRPAPAADRPQGAGQGDPAPTCRWSSSRTTCWKTRGRTSGPRPLEWRRGRLAEVVADAAAAGPARSSRRSSPPTRGRPWPRRARRSREVQAEGLMLKRIGSAYRVGRQRGDWWKWKVNPFTVDAVLTAAQPAAASGPASTPITPSGVWDQGQLVPIAKAYSGLTDEEIRRVDAFVRRHMIEKFGPVRTVTARAGLRAGLRGHPAVEPPQVGHRRPLPAHPPLARGQAGRRGRLARLHQGHAPPEDPAAPGDC